MADRNNVFQNLSEKISDVNIIAPAGLQAIRLFLLYGLLMDTLLVPKYLGSRKALQNREYIELV